MQIFSYFRIFTLICLILSLFGCISNKSLFNLSQIHSKLKEFKISQENFFDFVRPYKISIQQGHFLPKEIITQLKKGMTRNQVSSLLGTPFINNTLNINEWDYHFFLIKNNGQLTNNYISIIFKNNLVDYYNINHILLSEKDYLRLIIGFLSCPN